MTPSVLLVGHGSFGSLYARALRELGALGGIVVRTEASASRLRGEGAEPVWTSVGQALEELRPDGVAVLSPTAEHEGHLELALSRRLPAMVIKPAAVRPEDAERLAARAEAEGVPVLVGHEGLFAPAFRAMDEAVRDGAIGELRGIRWLNQGARHLSGGRELRPAEQGDAEGRNLGHLYATAMHELYVANRLAGRVAPARAEVANVFASSSAMQLDARMVYEPRGVELLLRYDATPDAPSRRGLHVVGSEGSALWVMEPGRTTLQVQRGRGPRRDLPFHGGGATLPATPLLQSFLEVIGGAAPRETLRDGARALTAARLLTLCAAERLGVAVDLDALAG